MLFKQLSSSHSINVVGHTALGLADSYQLCCYIVNRVHFPGFVPLSDTVDSYSVMYAKPCDSSVVIVYQVNEISCILLAEGLLCDHTFTLDSQAKCQ